MLDVLYRAACLTAASLLLSSPAPALAQPTQSSPFPGLELVQAKDVDALYRRPGVEIGAYTKVRIGDPVVEFSKNWNPRNYGRFGVPASQVKEIRTDMAALAKGVFTQVFQDGGYEVVTTAAPGVLEITPNIVDLYISAPETQDAGRTRVYVLDAGSMTLALQVNDSITGTLLAVALDQERAKSFGSLRWANSVTNRAEATSIITKWAKQLKQGLDASRAK